MTPDDLDKLIKLVYRNYKSSRKAASGGHPDEETMACFIESRLSSEEEQAVRKHLAECADCGQAFLSQIMPDTAGTPDVPVELVVKAKKLFSQSKEIPLFEVFLKLKDELFQLLATNGDVLVGQELMPAPVLRSRQVKGFKDEVIILKDIADIRVEIKVEKRGSLAFALSVNVRNKQNLQVLKDLRVTLLRDDLELESYINDSGKVVFEHVALGKYTVEISDLGGKMAAILLDIKT